MSTLSKVASCWIYTYTYKSVDSVESCKLLNVYITAIGIKKCVDSVESYLFSLP